MEEIPLPFCVQNPVYGTDRKQSLVAEGASNPYVRVRMIDLCCKCCSSRQRIMGSFCPSFSFYQVSDFGQEAIEVFISLMLEVCAMYFRKFLIKFSLQATYIRKNFNPTIFRIRPKFSTVHLVRLGIIIVIRVFFPKGFPTFFCL